MAQAWVMFRRTCWTVFWRTAWRFRGGGGYGRMRSGRQNVQLARPMDGQTKAISHNIRNGLGKVISGANIRERQPGSRHLGARRLTGATRRATPTKILLRRAVIGIEHLAVIRHNVYLCHQLLLGVPWVPPLRLLSQLTPIRKSCRMAPMLEMLRKMPMRTSIHMAESISPLSVISTMISTIPVHLRQ